MIASELTDNEKRAVADLLTRLVEDERFDRAAFESENEKNRAAVSLLETLLDGLSAEDEQTALREELADVTRQRDELSESLETASRELRVLKADKERAGLFDPRVAEHIRKAQGYEA